MREFKRGDVFTAYVPEFKYTDRSPAPGYILQGSHMVVMLHDSNDRLPQKSALVVPITSARNAASRGNMSPTYVKIEKKDHPFLRKEVSYISAHQEFPINRQWLGLNPVGRITDEKMLELDMQLIRVNGLTETIRNMMIDHSNMKLKEFEKSLKEMAASMERDIDIDRGYDR